MKKTLAIMAAGLGSRYGGLKQLDIIDSEKNAIIDYSIYDAIQAGFNHITIIIRRELHDSFLEKFSHLKPNQIKISYVFQEITDLPGEFANTPREKPWGTGQALLALRHTITTNFALINADDYYGRDAFKTMYNALFSSNEKQTFFMVGYKLKNTLSPFGSVSRGECYVSETNALKKVIERTKIDKKGSHIKYKDSNGNSTILDGGTIVSMNFWGFTPSIFTYAKSMFIEFLKENHGNPKSEFYLPLIASNLIKNNIALVKVLNTDSVWHGITFKEDKKHLVNAIEHMKSSKIYPKKLWKPSPTESIFNEFNHNEVYIKHFGLTSGHINDTYKIETLSGNDFVLQKINTSIFSNTKQLISNKVSVSQYLKKNSSYSVSDFIKTIKNDYLAIDAEGGIWTLCNFINNTEVFTAPKSKEIVRQAGKLLGDFHVSMKNYDVESLFETIKDFHNLNYRNKQYKEALKNASIAVIENIQDEINLLTQFKEGAEYIDQLKTTGQIPIRVTHNDAKLSNMLFNMTSKKAAALIDFDTIMPGIIHYDIGDAIRSICSVAEEDEANLDKVLFDINNYKIFMEGFLPIVKSSLTDIEKKTISYSIKYMLYEQSMRFLTDYLNGNIYYKVDYPEHNLVRTRNQLRLLEIINNQFEEIESKTKDILNN